MMGLLIAAAKRPNRCGRVGDGVGGGVGDGVGDGVHDGRRRTQLIALRLPLSKVAAARRAATGWCSPGGASFSLALRGALVLESSVRVHDGLADSENAVDRTALASLQSGSCQKGRDGVVLARRSLVLAGLEGAPWC